MWYTVLQDDAPIGFAELTSGALVASPMLRLPVYERIGPTTRAATDARLQLGRIRSRQRARRRRASPFTASHG